MAVYYLNHERFQKGDTTKALQFALSLMKEDKNIKTITLLVYQQLHYEPFLGELKFTPKELKNHGRVYRDVNLQVHTVKTYSPDYLFSGWQPSEVLIAVGVPPKHLEQFEDKSNVAHWIIVPWTLEENREILSVYEAIDIERGNAYPAPAPADERVRNAIGWLKSTSYPNEGYHHPNDSERLHEMANALKKYKVPVSYASAVYCGMHNGLVPSAARQTAEAFMRAQNRLFTVGRDVNYDFLKQMMSETHDNS